MKLTGKILKYIIISLPVFFLAAAILIRSGYLIDRKAYSYEFIIDMNRQAKVNPQDINIFFKDSSSLRTPPEHVIPRNKKIYPFGQADYAEAEKIYSNPLKPTYEILRRGKNRFEVFCAHCHGFKGRADGTVITKVKITDTEEGFPAPPDYLRPETMELSGARIFHIISAGQNLMKPAAHKLDEIDRWAIVLYIRELQKQ